ncbi:MAG: universal stress protein [Planctomycetes bacterium]|nr:universal stress protein [Planctomycetota bacterium]
MFERIVVPLDGSPTAETILPQVKRLLSRVSAEVVLVRAVQVPPLSDADSVTLIRGLRTEAERYLRELSERLRKDGVRITTSVSTGEPHQAILDAASQSGASIIAMSTHGRSGLARMVYGSVTEKVLLSTSEVPLLVFRSIPPESAPPPSTGAGNRIANILVTCDGSEESLAILPWVERLAQRFGARVVFLTVTEDVPHSPTPADETFLDAACARLSAASVPHARLVRRGDPVGEILDVCTEISADLLAMTTHGRSGFTRFVLGSVTDALVRRATVPMLLLRCKPRPAETAPREAASR